MSGVVLAGGASRRMGSDKALLAVDGERLVDRAVRVLRACCDDVIVAAGPSRRLGGLGVPQTRDGGRGPLDGIVAGLEAAEHELVAVLAVDLPAADADVFTRLAGAWCGQAAVVPRVDGRLQPLHGVWARASAPALRARLAAGQRGVVAACEALGAHVVDVAGTFARNLNRPP